LAKTLAPAGANSASVTQSPTITSPALMTGVGVLLGTAAYMSPEQAKGREADKRSDVWAFGCVLYEMLTGKRAFDGDEISDTLAAVLRAEPDWSKLPAGTPVSVRRLLRRCLTRNLRLRLQDIADGRIEIEEALASPHAESVHPLSRQGASVWRPRIAIAAVTLIIGAVAGWALRPIAGNPTSFETSVWGLSIVQPQGTVFTTDAPQISPDGRVVAFVAIDTSGRTLLYVRFLDSSDVRSLPGTDGASMPFWSPDSQALGFFAQGQLKIVGLSGGDPQSLAAALVPRGGTWNRDGVILFASPLDLQSVSTSGGPTISLRKTQKLPTGRQSPSFLPDGRHYLYITARTGIGQTVHVGSLDSAESKEVVMTTSTAVYSEAGYLFFRRGAALMAQRFDHESRETIGSPIVVASSVAINPVTNQTLMSISRGGTLVYFDALARSQLTVTDRLGRQLAVAGSPGYRQSLCLTDDESRVVFEEVDFASGNADLWALDLGRAPAVRLTFDAALDFFPVCPANRQEDVIFTSLRSGVAQLFRVPLSEPGKDELLSSDPQIRVPEHRSLDNRWLVYRTPGATNDWDVWVMPLESPDRPSAFAASAADERDARLSPDGRWIAYAVIERGQSEVVVQSFPKPGARWQVSPGGGSQPQWRRDGKELFYLARDNKLMVIDIDTNGRTPVYSTPRALFDSDITSLDLGSYGRQYAVFKDGQRFLLNRRSDEAIPITVIVNWKPPAP
jgi:Tol biopolymer transport system component